MYHRWQVIYIRSWDMVNNLRNHQRWHNRVRDQVVQARLSCRPMMVSVSLYMPAVYVPVPVCSCQALLREAVLEDGGMRPLPGIEGTRALSLIAQLAGVR